MKREGVSTLFIPSYLRALSCLLDYLKMRCLKMCFVVGFESILQNSFVAVNFVIILVSIRMHKSVGFENSSKICLFLKMF